MAKFFKGAVYTRPWTVAKIDGEEDYDSMAGYAKGTINNYLTGLRSGGATIGTGVAGGAVVGGALKLLGRGKRFRGALSGGTLLGAAAGAIAATPIALRAEHNSVNKNRDMGNKEHESGIKFLGRTFGAGLASAAGDAVVPGLGVLTGGGADYAMRRAKSKTKKEDK